MTKRQRAEMIRQWNEQIEGNERRAKKYDNAANQLAGESKWYAFLRLMAADERAAAKRGRAIVEEIEKNEKEDTQQSRQWHDNAIRFGEPM